MHTRKSERELQMHSNVHSLSCMHRYTTMMPGILRFPNEINIVRKEVFNNWYKLRTYYFAALITSMPIHVSYIAYARQQ